MAKLELNEQQINDLIEQYKPMISNIIGKHKYLFLDEYDDVFQYGLLGLWYGITHYDDSRNTKLSTFLYMSIHSKIRDVYKSRKEKHEIENATISYDAFESFDEEMDLDAQIGVIASGRVMPVDVNNKIMYEKVLSDISVEKDEKLRKMVLMYYVDQMGYTEIARKLECTKQNVETRIKTYIKRYRNTLIQSGYIE